MIEVIVFLIIGFIIGLILGTMITYVISDGVHVEDSKHSFIEGYLLGKDEGSPATPKTKDGGGAE